MAEQPAPSELTASTQFTLSSQAGFRHSRAVPTGRAARCSRAGRGTRLLTAQAQKREQRTITHCEEGLLTLNAKHSRCLSGAWPDNCQTTLRVCPEDTLKDALEARVAPMEGCAAKQPEQEAASCAYTGHTLARTRRASWEGASHPTDWGRGHRR